jgi:hypothetical protein
MYSLSGTADTMPQPEAIAHIYASPHVAGCAHGAAPSG